ncbi:MAG TPA: RNA polymerase sigma factor [Candidatus Eisenbacteria bacterium]|nr:RNA polymerase sigma factor [Candidatus Eisenbacteria bacterium]
MESTAEQELVIAAKGGDIAAFEAILVPLIEPAHRFATALLQDPDLAKDAVQEACVRAWRKLGRVRPGSPVRPWFLGIVANQCREQMRGRWWQVIRISHSPRLNAELPEDSAIRNMQVREALIKLGERERRVLILRAYLDLPWAEVAAASGLTEAGARSRYYRAIDRLRPPGASQEAIT